MHRLRKFFPLLIIGAGLLAYLATFGHPFIFDDYRTILDNRVVRGLDPLAPGPRMVVDQLFIWNYAYSGPYVVSDYHAVNLSIHIVAALLLFLVIRLTLRLPRLTVRFGSAAPWLAGVSALIWLLHPLQTQSVTYISQRYESFMGMMYLLGFYAFARGVSSRRARWWFDLAILACGIGMGTKEVMVTAPVVFLLYDAVVVTGSLRASLRARWKVHVALFATWGIWGLLLFWDVAHGTFHATGSMMKMPPLQYLLTQFDVVVHYLRLSFVPTPLCLDYAWQPVATGSRVLLPGMLLAGLGGLSLWAMVKGKPVGFLGAWFFVILAPTSSILPVGDIAFEHRMYLPLAAVVVGSVLGVYRLLCVLLRDDVQKRRAIGVVMAVVSVAVLMSMTVARNEDYRSREAIWQDVVDQVPDNYRAHLALVGARLEGGDARGAERAARELKMLTGEALGPAGPERAYGARNPAVYYPSAVCRLGLALLHQDRAREAAQAFSEALLHSRDSVEALVGRATALSMLDQTQEAIADCRRAVRIQPEYAQGNAILGQLLVRDGRYREAAPILRRALETEPNSGYAKFSLAWLLATSPHEDQRSGVESLLMAEWLCEVTNYKSVRAMDLRGAALAELKRYAVAQLYAERALELLLLQEDDPVELPMRREALDSLAKEIRLRVKLYQSNDSFRMPLPNRGKESTSP